MDIGQNLGGRLALLGPSELSPEQQELYGRLGATRLAAAGRSGYRAALDDGRLIGPFNALLRIPDVGQRQVEWAQAITAQGLSSTVREAVILTVAAEWDADYIAYAHAIAGRAAGLADSAIAELPTGSIFHKDTVFGIARTARLMFITLSFNERAAETKNALFEALVRHLDALAGWQRREVMFRVIETARENWWADGRVVNPDTGYDERMASTA